MDFLSWKGVPFKFDFKTGSFTHTVVVGSTRNGMTINPVANFAAEPDWCLRMVQNAAQYDLGFNSFDLAREIGLRVAAQQAPNIKVLVDAWKQEPALNEFADAVAKAMLPQ